MKFVIAPDKFKGSLTGIEFCKAVEKGIKRVIPKAEFISLPLADGGDGTIEVINHYLKGKTLTLEVNNPFFESVEASYLYSESSKIAFIEMAEASGHKLLDKDKLDCKNTTTLGTGELIIDAIDKGVSKIILGIGGSATNDCGIGMATALGYRFLDENKEPVKPVGANLSKVVSIDSTNINKKLSEITFEIACDVTNPLYGENGAAHVYAAQKGATLDDIKMLDAGLKDFSRILNAVFSIDVQSIKGAGAAGGMGIASKVFLNGKLQPGIQLIKNLADFDAQIVGADWVITGEGKLDIQTLSGKTIQGVISSAKSKNIKLAAFCGAIDLNENEVKSLGIHYSDSIFNYSNNLRDAMSNASNYVQNIAEIFAKKL